MGKRILEYMDWPLVCFGAAIIAIGLLNLYSATYNLPVAARFQSQLLWVLAGTCTAAVILFFDYRILSHVAIPLYIICIIMLMVLLATGTSVSGSTRWFNLGPIHFQPSELTKIALILVLAKVIKSRDDQPPYHLLQLWLPITLIIIPMILIQMQPDLGTALSIGITGVSILYIIGIGRKTMISMGTLAALSIPLAWIFVLTDYQKGRIITFLQPEKYPLGGGYQVIQSKIAVGSGQLFGKGFLEGTQTKLMFLPKQYTDFIFSNFAEEWGFFGCMILLFCIAMFVFSGLNVAIRAKDKFGALIATGITAYFFWNFFINIAMELGILPVVGIALPFLSYGGSSMMTSFIAFGLLLNISVRRFLF